MKRAISVLLIITSILGCCSMLFACKKDETAESEGNGLKYSTEAAVDFSVAENITASGLSVRTDIVKTAANSASWKPAEKSSVEFNIAESKTDLTLYKELSVWINNTSSSDFTLGTVKLVCGTDADYYKSTAITVHPGWHQYNIPFSEMTAIGSPSKSTVKKIVFDVLDAVNGGSFEILIDTFYVKTQKYGTTAFFKDYPELAHAVAFYDEHHKYLYDQCRYILKEGDENVAISSDSYTTYVPVSVLAEHKGATGIVATKEKVSFNYNGQAYEFTPSSDISFTGISSGSIPGQGKTVKPVVSGEYIMLPMEYCASIFGYDLFYNQMFIAIFYDRSELKNGDLSFADGTPYERSEEELSTLDATVKKNKKDETEDKVYDLILEIVNDNYTGEELLQNMDELYGTEEHTTRVLASQEHFDKLRELVDTDPVYSAWFRKFEAAYKDLPTKKFVFGLYDGYRMLDIAREFQERVIAYGFLYKMTDNEDYAEVVRKAMLDYCAMVDPWTKQRSWHVEHPIDFGEILYGFGIGYDWCYDYYSDEDLETIEDAAWEIGYGTFLGFGGSMQWWFDPANYTAYQETITDKQKEEGDYIKITGQGRISWYYPGTEKLKEFGITKDVGDTKDGGPFVMSTEAAFAKALWINNYDCVCNGGLVNFLFAFANVNENFRAATAYTLDCASFAIKWGIKDGYAPDGGYPEGTGYWDYGTRYTAQYLQAMYNATGIDQGYIDLPGFSESFYYVFYIETSEYGVWNYHDQDQNAGLMSKQLFTWAAYRFNSKDFATLYMKYAKEDKGCNHAFTLLFYDPDMFDGDEVEMSLDHAYTGLSLSTFRSDWDTSSVFTGLHGGWNNWSHSMHDIGQFILEFDGVRFFTVLGKDEYNLLAYQSPNSTRYGYEPTYKSNPQGYWYYRNRAEGTNTLVIDPTRVDTGNFNAGDEAQGTNFDQLHAVYSETLRFESGENSALAVIDMSVAYDAAYLSRMIKGTGRRGLLLTEDRSTVVIQDEFELTADKSHTVYWFAHTYKGMDCTISDDKKTAVLTLDGKSMLCQIVVPKGATYDFNFSFGPADYLSETGLSTQDGEYSRVGLSKLIAKGEGLSGTVKLAIVCRPLYLGESSYTYTNIDDWKVD